MNEENNIKDMVDNDIVYFNEIWDKYSHDVDKMEELFNKILFKYISIVEGIDCGLKVISTYEESNKKAETFRANITLLMKRIIAFKSNKYRNEGLYEYYLKSDASNGMSADKYFTMGFNEARHSIENDSSITSREKEEIIDKIDEIEEICRMAITKNAKWEHLRPYVFWLSGKDLNVAKILIPLFLKIN